MSDAVFAIQQFPGICPRWIGSVRLPKTQEIRGAGHQIIHDADLGWIGIPPFTQYTASSKQNRGAE